MLADRLKLLRKKKAITQLQFAKEFNVASGTIAMWETGRREPDLETVRRLARYFGVTVDYLIGNEEEPTPVSEDGQSKQDETDRKIIDYVTRMTPEQKDLFLALLQTAVAHNQEKPVAGLASVGGAALKV